MAKCLVITLGESFRAGPQNTRIRGMPESVNPQKDAIESQVKFLHMLNDKYKYDVDLFVHTYTTPYDEILIQGFANSSKNKEIIISRDVAGLNVLYQSCIQKVNNIEEYDFVFITRVDLCYKDLFYHIFNPQWNKIMFTSRCFKIHGHEFESYLGYPRVADLMAFIPKNCYDIIHPKTFKLTHESWYNYRDHQQYLGLMLTTLHDSNSQLDWNPLYYIVNRYAADRWRTPGKETDPYKNIIFDSERFKTIQDFDKLFK